MSSAVSKGPVARLGIMELAPYVGGASKLAGVERVIKLSSNEGAFGPSPKAMAALAQYAPDMHRYPHGSVAGLREAIGRRWGLDPERIVCGSGSDELIFLLIRAYAGVGDEVLQTRYGFLVFSIAAMGAGATPTFAAEHDLHADVDSLLAAVTERTKLVFVANPNNPTGTYIPYAEIQRLHAGLPPHVVLVLDAAYAEFVSRNDFDAGAELVKQADNVVMLRTFSKIYGMGGLRLGWALCPPGIADVLNRLRGPFNVSSAAEAAGIAALDDLEFAEMCKAHNDYWLPWLTERLEALGIEVVPSVCNFVLARFSSQERAEAADRHLNSRGIIVRKVAAYGLPDALRITVGREDEMRAVASALTEFVSKQ